MAAITRPAAEARMGIAFAVGAAILYGAAYPATAVALRSFSPLAIAGLACSIALPVVVVLAAVAAILFGLYIVLARRWARAYGIDGTSVTIANLLGRGPILLLVEAVRQAAPIVPADVDPTAVVAVLTIAFGSSSTANL